MLRVLQSCCKLTDIKTFKIKLAVMKVEKEEAAVFVNLVRDLAVKL